MIRILSLLLLFISFPAAAQIPSKQPDGEIVSKPVCSAMVNRSDVTIMGTLATQKQDLGDGTLAAHQDNFKLKAGEKKDFCVSGPFFQGQRILVTLRTVVPLFSCKTKIDREIYLYSKLQPDGSRKLSADCR